MRYLIKTCHLIIIFISILTFLNPAYAEDKIITTRYTRIHYSSDQALSGFIWRISGKRIELVPDKQLIKRAVDRIFERVEAILDMYPEDMVVDFYLEPKYDDGYIAYYDHHTRSIIVYSDRVTDGVLAHEIAHAVINAYFDVPPPTKMQEILTRYVDQHLWSDY